MLLAVAIPKTNSVPSRLRRRSAGRGGTLRDANGGATPAQADRRGTVQKVDVTIGSWTSKRVEEAGEEAVGSYVLYRNGTPTVADIASLTPVTFICEPNDLPSDSIIRITHSGKGTLYQREAGGSELMPVTTLTTDAASLGGKDFFLHGSTVSSTVADSFIRIEHPDSEAVDEAMYTVLNLSLDMPDLFHSEAIPSEEKQNPGAFIHWNIDNDDESLSLVVPKHFGGDYLQTNESVENEDDLVPLKITIKPVPLGGEVSLSCGNGVALWRSPIKGQQDARFMASGQTRSWPLQTAVSQEILSTMRALPFFAEGVSDVPTEVCISYANPYTQTPVSDSITITPIAANCGNQPEPYTQRIVVQNTSVVGCEWSVTDPDDNPNYNCMGFVVNETNKCYDSALTNQQGEPIEYRIEDGVTRWSIDYKYGNRDGVWSLEDFDGFMLTKLELIPTDSISDATVIYYHDFHAAKRKNCPCGMPNWRMFESKMGEGICMEHLPDSLSPYGTPIRYYRPVASTAELITLLNSE